MIIHVKIIRHSERFDYKYFPLWIFYIGNYWDDSPLTTKGHEIAFNKGKQIFKEGFYPKYIYTSPYTRTMATATELKNTFYDSQLIIEPLLSEFQPYFKHKINLYPNGIPTKFNNNETNFIFPESNEKFIERVLFIFSNLLEKSDDNIIIVTHGELLKIYINYLIKKFPEINLNNEVFYLTTLSFDYDKEKKIIISDTIILENN